MYINAAGFIIIEQIKYSCYAIFSFFVSSSLSVNENALTVVPQINGVSFMLKVAYYIVPNGIIPNGIIPFGIIQMYQLFLIKTKSLGPT